MANSGSRRRSWQPCLIAAVLLSALCAGPVRAQEGEQQALAEALFQAGREQMDAGNFGEACQKFEESNRLDPSAGTLLNWGRCLEAQGKTASAWATYQRTVALGKVTNKQRQVDAATEFLAALEPRLAKLEIRVVAAVPGLVITRGGVEIGPAAQGFPAPVDPGEVVVRAEAPGYRSIERRVTLKEGATETLLLPRLEASPKRVAPIPPPPPELGPHPLFVTGGVAMGVGAAALAAGAVLGVQTLDEAAQAEEDPALCPGKACSPAGLAFIEDTKQKAAASSATLALGGVLLAAGGVMMGIAAHQRGGLAHVVRIEPRLIHGTMSVGVDLVGSF